MKIIIKHKQYNKTHMGNYTTRETIFRKSPGRGSLAYPKKEANNENTKGKTNSTEWHRGKG